MPPRGPRRARPPGRRQAKRARERTGTPSLTPTGRRLPPPAPGQPQLGVRPRSEARGPGLGHRRAPQPLRSAAAARARGTGWRSPSAQAALAPLCASLRGGSARGRRFRAGRFTTTSTSTWGTWGGGCRTDPLDKDPRVHVVRGRHGGSFGKRKGRGKKHSGS